MHWAQRASQPHEGQGSLESGSLGRTTRTIHHVATCWRQRLPDKPARVSRGLQAQRTPTLFLRASGQGAHSLTLKPCGRPSRAMAHSTSNDPTQQSKAEPRSKELTQDDPDHELRGEDQLVDGVSEVVEPGSFEE